jgi:PAS domain S-box-containing protein
MEQVQKAISVKKLIFAVSFSIFLGEVLIMTFMDYFLNYSKYWIALIDSILLVLITFPFVHYFSFRPLKNQLIKVKNHEIKLAQKHKELSDANTLAVESETKYISLFDFAPVGYMVINYDGTILEINHTGATLLGLPKFNAIHQNINAFLSSDDRKLWATFVQRVIDSDFKLECKLVINRADESAFYALLECIHESTEIETNIRISFTDITKENFLQYQ